MRTVVLDGSLRGSGAAAAVAAVATRELRAEGHGVVVLAPREDSIAACSGCFRCWFKTPGICVTDDDARRSVEAIATADLVVLVSPVTYGGYSSPVKAVLDRSIGLISPLFTTIGGETHHCPRYERYPAWAIVGVQAEEDPAEALVFRTLAARNALNFYASGLVADVLVAGGGRGGAAELGDEVEEHVGRLVADAVAVVERIRGAGAPDAVVDAPRAEGVLSSGTPAQGEAEGGPASAAVLPPPRSALLLVGSPRRGRSTSASLATYLGERLGEAGIAVETVGVRAAVEAEEGVRELRQAVRAADLIVVLTPLYVDSLPAPVTRALELLGEEADLGAPPAKGGQGEAATEEAVPMDAALAQAGPRLRRLVAVVNSGFPEATQCDTALAICRTFARRTAMHWAGGLALGAGAALDGRPLDEAGDMAGDVRRALDSTAMALVAGEAVPAEAVDLMARPPVPAPLYREMGDRGFRRLAEREGVVERLGDRPYVPPEPV